MAVRIPALNVEQHHLKRVRGVTAIADEIMIHLPAFAEKQAAERAAWAAPGVSAVDNRVEVNTY
jgi:hypothetical protein